MKRLALALCLFSLGARQDERVRLESKLASGWVRIAEVKFESSGTYTQGIDDLKGSTKMGEERTYTVHDWFEVVENGRPKKIWRSYEGIASSSTTDGNKIPKYDTRQNQTFAMNVAEDGSLRLTHKPGIGVNEPEVATVLGEREVSWLPGKEVAVGESWSVPAEQLGAALTADGSTKFLKGECTVTLESGATLAIQARLEFRSTQEANGEVYGSMDLVANLKGTAKVDVDAGRLTSLEFTGRVEGKGKTYKMQTSLDLELKETRTFRYSALHSGAVDNGKEGPDAVKDIYVSQIDQVPADQLVLVRSGSEISRIQTFDPASKKIGKTLLGLPKGVTLDQPALSPSRSRIAVVSNGNSLISLAGWNVFVYETASGEVNQVTPEWATGKGLAERTKADRTATLRGRIAWFDDERRITRNDVISGYARVDRSVCFANIGSDGRFEIKDVPVGHSYLIVVRGIVPNYSTGKQRSDLGSTWQAQTVALVNGDQDLGTLTIHAPKVDLHYAHPSWTGNDTLTCQNTGFARHFRIGYPKRSFESLNLGDLDFGGAFSSSPDGSKLSFSTGRQVGIFDASGKSLAGFTLNEGLSIESSAGRVWGKEGNLWLAGGVQQAAFGEYNYGAPILMLFKVAEKQAFVIKKFPQWTGARIVSIAMDPGEDIAYLVVHFTDVQKNVTMGDLWAWDSRTDVTTRITSLGDVMGVANAPK